MNYETFKQNWKTLAHEKKLTCYDMAFLCIIRAMKKDNPKLAIKYLLKAFTSVTNKVKLENGRNQYDTLIYAIDRIEYSLFPTETSPSVIASQQARRRKLLKSYVEEEKEDYEFNRNIRLFIAQIIEPLNQIYFQALKTKGIEPLDKEKIIVAYYEDHRDLGSYVGAYNE